MSETIKILIAGDYVPQHRVSNLIDKSQFADVFSEVLPYTQAADYSIVNLESPVVQSFSAKPIDKSGPRLKCSPKAIESLVYAGFDMVTLANNHFYDYGEEGVEDTLQTCEAYDIDVIGGGRNLYEASMTVYKQIKGVRFAFINCCEHEFSIAEATSGGANPINPVKQYYAIREAKNRADKIIVIVHGGFEHYQLPSSRMVETYRFFIDAGADVVINHHQHCYSGYEVYNNKPIFYGIGNFCFDWEGRNSGIWTEGYIVTLLFTKGDGVEFVISPYKQCDDTVGIHFITDDEKFKFCGKLNELNKIISNPERLISENSKYYDRCSNHELRILEPYSGRMQNYLYNKKLLPSCMTKSKCLSVYNHIYCESHREKITYALKSRFKDVIE